MRQIVLERATFSHILESICKEDTCHKLAEIFDVNTDTDMAVGTLTVVT